MDAVFARLAREGVPYLLESYSALDRYFRVREPGDVFIRTDASLVMLAQLFDGLSFPGGSWADAEVRAGDTSYLFRCVDDLEGPSGLPFTALELLYNAERDAFRDPQGVYGDLRQGSLVRGPAPAGPLATVMEAARLVSRYHYTAGEVPQDSLQGVPEPPAEGQRGLLRAILTSRYPDKGLELLRRTGFVAAYWPELAAMGAVEHSKDYHPEGNVWAHTLAALRSRKHFGFPLAAALLLHDIGKPLARGSKDRPFDNHAEIGAAMAGRFLRRLGFSESLVAQVDFLVRFHMMPEALPRMPLYRTERLMASPLFPELLELYRADLASTFRPPAGYYEACRIYQHYLRESANPHWVPERSKPPV